jgi:hypothetical protein
VNAWVEVEAGDETHFTVSVLRDPPGNLAPVSYMGGHVERQKWPRRAHQADLLEVIRKYARGNYGIDAPMGSPVRITTVMGPLEICYQQEKQSQPHYRLLGVKHSGIEFDEWVIPGEEQEVGHERLARELLRVMPGLRATVPFPCSCGKEAPAKNSVQAVIIHLNDRHHPTKGSLKGDPWDRERIAQWTEELDVDLTVDTSRPPPPPRPRKRAIKMTDEQKQALLKSLVTMKIDTSSMQKALAEAAAGADQVVETMKGFTAYIEFKDEHLNPELVEKMTGLFASQNTKEEA